MTSQNDLKHDGKPEDRKEAIKTFIEQTKLLVTLSSAFVVAPAAFATILKDNLRGLVTTHLYHFVWAEGLFIASVLMGYFVLATISGYQNIGKYDVYRPSTRAGSLLQIGFYLFGLVVFVRFISLVIY